MAQAKMSKKLKSSFLLELKARQLRLAMLKDKTDTFSVIERKKIEKDIPFIQMAISIWG